LLSAMYVFKRLSGVAAVQTLSRLNRTYVTPAGQVKATTMVLDFVNDAAEIQAAFQPYFRDAHIETETDPNIVNDIAAKLDQANLYTSAEIEQAAAAWVASNLRKSGGHNALAAAVQPAQQRFWAAHAHAEAEGDKTELAKLDLFRRDVATFVRVYDFMSQIIDYGAELEKRANFYRLLERLLRASRPDEQIDLGDVTLRTVAQVNRGATDIKLGVDDDAGLKGITGAGSGARREPKMVALQEVIDRLNDLFADAALTAGQKQTFVEGLLHTLLADATLVAQAQANTKKQFLESPRLTDGVLDAVADNQAAHDAMADTFSTDTATRNDIIRLVGAALYEWVVAERSGAGSSDATTWVIEADEEVPELAERSGG
ncbi:MAG TPA: hypothetical protein PLV68_13905, partial [Ilumatobacteraceae bacterium]|nr:hypothetical protein [Ilumatobacteraceae bacterium]